MNIKSIKFINGQYELLTTVDEKTTTTIIYSANEFMKLFNIVKQAKMLTSGTELAVEQEQEQISVEEQLEAYKIEIAKIMKEQLKAYEDTLYTLKDSVERMISEKRIYEEINDQARVQLEGATKVLEQIKVLNENIKDGIIGREQDADDLIKEAVELYQDSSTRIKIAEEKISNSFVSLNKMADEINNAMISLNETAKRNEITFKDFIISASDAIDKSTKDNMTYINGIMKKYIELIDSKEEKLDSIEKHQIKLEAVRAYMDRNYEQEKKIFKETDDKINKLLEQIKSATKDINEVGKKEREKIGELFKVAVEATKELPDHFATRLDVIDSLISDYDIKAKEKIKKQKEKATKRVSDKIEGELKAERLIDRIKKIFWIK